jgi:hypothetical protein
LIDTPIPHPRILVQVYAYLHMYPRQRQVKAVLGCSRKHLQRKILPALHYLAKSMHEIFWDDRLDLNNHAPHFPYLFVGMVDTFPLRVLQPVHRPLARALYNPKYGGCIYKGQLAIDFLGIV